MPPFFVLNINQFQLVHFSFIHSSFCFDFISDCNESSYFYIQDSTSKHFKVQKQQFVRVLNDTNPLSVDRKQRFKQKKKSTCRLTQGDTPFDLERKKSVTEFDFILLKGFEGVARVLEFKKIGNEVKTVSASRVLERTVDINDASQTSIGMLVQCYIISKNCTLSLVDSSFWNTTQFVPLSSYINHVPAPSFVDNQFKLSNEMMSKLSSIIQLEPVEPFSRGFGSNVEKSNKDADPDFDCEIKWKKNNRKATKQMQKAKNETIDSNSEDEAIKKFLSSLKNRRR